ITDHASGRSWSPVLTVQSSRPTAPVLTVDRVEEEYALPKVYELEASGFFPTACRFAATHLVHCFKVIADGPESPLSTAAEGSPRLASVFVQELIEASLPE